VVFRCLASRFIFRAIDPVFFPQGTPGNAFRGAFGHIFRRIACVPTCQGVKGCDIRDRCAYARIFEPACLDGPSGLADAPRPFVIRAGGLNGRQYEPGDLFSIDVHLFDLHEPVLKYFVLAFSQFAETGLGPGRGRVSLNAVCELNADRTPGRSLFDLTKSGAVGKSLPLELELEPPAQPVSAIRVCFRTPTELRSSGAAAPVENFVALFSRIRDRVSTLRALYGDGPLDIDFRGMAERARAVRTVRSQVQMESVRRRSSRTAQEHPLSGITGEVDYEGDLTEFVPFLEAAYWTGVGKHTVWGNGALESSRP